MLHNDPQPLEHERIYKPPQTVQDFIERLELAPVSQWVSQLTDRDKLKSVPPEAWIYFSRKFMRSGDEDRAWELATVAGKWVERRLGARLRKWGRISVSQKEELVDDILMNFYEQCLSDRPADLFWQVRAGVCVDRQLAKHLERHMRKSRLEHVALDGGDDGEEFDMERLPDHDAGDPQVAAIAKHAISQVKEPWRTAFHLIHHVDLSEDEAARLMGVTTRTIRNYLRSARETLRAYLAEEA